MVLLVDKDKRMYLVGDYVWENLQINEEKRFEGIKEVSKLPYLSYDSMFNAVSPNNDYVKKVLMEFYIKLDEQYEGLCETNSWDAFEEVSIAQKVIEEIYYKLFHERLDMKLWRENFG